MLAPESIGIDDDFLEIGEDRKTGIDAGDIGRHVAADLQLNAAITGCPRPLAGFAHALGRADADADVDRQLLAIPAAQKIP